MGKTNRLGVLLTVAAAALVAVGLVVLMLVVEARPAQATFPGTNGKIAYSVWNGRESDIYTIDPGGGRRVNITNNVTDDNLPSYSPNGKKIAYSHGRRGLVGKDSEIYTINATGGKPFRVTNNKKDDFAPSYSPSGKKIAYQGFDGKDWEVYTINVTGGKPFQLTNNNTEDGAPSWGGRP
jgi:TolB protein